MNRLNLVAASLSLASASVCFPEYQSIFLWTSDDRTLEVTFDLRSLCTVSSNGVGGPDRSFIVPMPPPNQRFNWTVWYTFGGNNTKRCNPTWGHYNSGGSFIQQWDTWRPSTDPQNIWAGKFTTDPETGKNVSVDAPCEIIAHSRPDFDLIDPSNPLTGGISLSYQGLPDSVADAFNQCPKDNRWGSNLPRTVTVLMMCDPNGAVNDVTPVGWIEVSPCTYQFTVKSKAGCGVQGDPIAQQIYASEQAKTQPATNFGFTILGGFLFFVLQVAFVYANQNGYIDMVRSKIGLGSSSSNYLRGTSSGSGGASSVPLNKASSGYGST